MEDKDDSDDNDDDNDDDDNDDDDDDNRDFLNIQRRGRQRERQKKVGFISKTTTFLFPFLHDYDVKMPNFPFYGGRKQTTTKFNFSF